MVSSPGFQPGSVDTLTRAALYDPPLLQTYSQDDCNGPEDDDGPEDEGDEGDQPTSPGFPPIVSPPLLLPDLTSESPIEVFPPCSSPFSNKGGGNLWM